MKRSRFLPCLRAGGMMAAGVLLLSGCAGGPGGSEDSAEEKKEAFTDPASGIVFPKHLDSFERVSLNSDDSGKNPLSAHYTATVPVRTPEDPLPRMERNLAFYLNADVRVIPSLKGTPDQIISQTVRSLENFPNFAQSEYQGAKSFGNQTAFCTQCSFDRPAWNDRATLKIVIVPRGNYLICFSFLVRPAQEQDWQGTIDSFVRDILAKSTKEGPMTPEYAPQESEGNA